MNMEGRVLTSADLRNILVLLSSSRLTISGQEAQPLAMLQWKIKQEIEAMESEGKDGDDSGPTEQGTDGAA